MRRPGVFRPRTLLSPRRFGRQRKFSPFLFFASCVFGQVRLIRRFLHYWRPPPTALFLLAHSLFSGVTKRLAWFSPLTSHNYCRLMLLLLCSVFRCLRFFSLAPFVPRCVSDSRNKEPQQWRASRVFVLSPSFGFSRSSDVLIFPISGVAVHLQSTYFLSFFLSRFCAFLGTWPCQTPRQNVCPGFTVQVGK